MAFTFSVLILYDDDDDDILYVYSSIITDLQ